MLIINMLDYSAGWRVHDFDTVSVRFFRGMARGHVKDGGRSSQKCELLGAGAGGRGHGIWDAGHGAWVSGRAQCLYR